MTLSGIDSFNPLTVEKGQKNGTGLKKKGIKVLD